MDIWNTIGFTASLLGAITYAPEVLKAIKSKHLNDVSWGMLTLVLVSSTLWFIYGVKFEILPVILSSLINVIFSAVLISLKHVYMQKSKDNNEQQQTETV
jgi:MtN3 and saliva related transmembrane protein